MKLEYKYLRFLEKDCCYSTLYNITEHEHIFVTLFENFLLMRYAFRQKRKKKRHTTKNGL